MRNVIMGTDYKAYGQSMSLLMLEETRLLKFLDFWAS